MAVEKLCDIWLSIFVFGELLEIVNVEEINFANLITDHQAIDVIDVLS